MHFFLDSISKKAIVTIVIHKHYATINALPHDHHPCPALVGFA